MRRRTTRYFRSGVLLEDLWVSERTPERLLRRQHKVPRDVETTVEFVDSVTPDDEQSVDWEDRLMAPSEATQYRAMVARLNFLSIDRPDLQFCVKESARNMSAPTNGDWKAVKRIGR